MRYQFPHSQKHEDIVKMLFDRIIAQEWEDETRYGAGGSRGKRRLARARALFSAEAVVSDAGLPSAFLRVIPAWRKSLCAETDQ